MINPLVCFHGTHSPRQESEADAHQLWFVILLYFIPHVAHTDRHRHRHTHTPLSLSLVGVRLAVGGVWFVATPTLGKSLRGMVEVFSLRGRCVKVLL